MSRPADQNQWRKEWERALRACAPRYTERFMMPSDPGLASLRTLGQVGLAIPAWEMALFVALLSVFMLLGRAQLGLIVTYLFVLYWGFVCYWPNFFEAARGDALALGVYLLCGVALAFLVLIAFFLPSDGRL